MNLLNQVAKRNASLADAIKVGKPFVCPVTRRFAQQISKEKLGYSDPGSLLLGVDEATASARFVISTENQDRDGDVVVSRGVKLDNYRKNPVVLFGHGQNGWDVPIGRATAIDVKRNSIEATLQFDMADPDAAFIFRKIADGYLRTTSIGFMPLEGEELSDSGSEYWYPGVRFDSWELLEISVVPTPANPEALMVGRGVNVSDRMRKWISTYAPKPRVVIPMATKAKWKHKVKELPSKTDDKPSDNGQPPGVAEGAAKQAPATDVQAVLCPKTQYADQSAAVQWVTNHGFSAEQMVEQQDAWAFVQFNADECDAATADAIDLGDGCTGVKCNGRVDPNKQQGDLPPGDKPNQSEGKAMGCHCGGTCGPCKATKDAEFAELVAKALVIVRKMDGMNEASGADGGNSVPDDDYDNPEQDDSKRPHSYRCLQALIAHMEEHIPQMDQPKVKAFYEATIAKAKSLLASVHGSGDDESSDDEADDGETDDEFDFDSDEDKSLDLASVLPALESLRKNNEALRENLMLMQGKVP